MMLYTSLLEYGGLSVDDEVRIRGKFIPPCPKGISPVGKKFITYMIEEDNLFTITGFKAMGNLLFISVFEVSNSYLYYNQILNTKTGGKIRILNWRDKWEQKLLSLRTAAE